MGRKLKKTEAEAEAEHLRTAIRSGQFQAARRRGREWTRQEQAPLTFGQFAKDWSERRGYQLVGARDNDCRLKLIWQFVLPGTEPPMTLGEKPVGDITAGDVEAYRYHRRLQKRSPVTINHDLKLLRKMFAWGIRERLLTATPFKVAGEA